MVNNYNDFQKYVPIDLANYSAVIASEAKRSDAKHRPEKSRGVPRLTRDDPLADQIASSLCASQ
jgi:hypothetical protein